MRNKQFLFALAFVFIFLITHVIRLQNDTINPDGVNWHYRSQQFINGLKYHQWEKTYQHYHPGVTLMWVTGVPVELFKQISGMKAYDVNNFASFDFVAKFSLVIVQLILSLFILYYLSKIVGFNKSLLFVFILSLEPFFLGNARLYHLDVLLTLFLFLGIIFTYLSTKEFFYRYSILAGITFSLAFLTKSVGVGGIFFFLFIQAICLFRSSFAKKYFITLLTGLSIFVVTTFIFFPALWVRPIYYISEIFSEGARVGVRGGHEQIFFGEDTVDAGMGFYPLILLIRLSPFIWIGVCLFILNIKNILNKNYKYFVFILVTFYLTYFVAMSFPTKKLDRYMIVMFPLFSFLTTIGFAELRKMEKGFEVLVGGVLYGIFVVLPVIALFPYNFTYTSPFFGSAQNANNIIALKPFGIGMYDLKSFLYSKYGTDKKLGFIDTKPMKSIYANSKVFDIRVNGTSDYDLIILGINEQMPEDVLTSKTHFYKDSSLFINGLEYWRVYAKE